MKNISCCTQKLKKTQKLNKSFFRNGIMSILGLKSGDTVKHVPEPLGSGTTKIPVLRKATHMDVHSGTVICDDPHWFSKDPSFRD